MPARWTKEQEMAINTRGSNLLVSASAGTGKTAVLVERILRLISDQRQPVDIDRLLVLTFTKAAAAEMRSRIVESINDRLSANPGLIQRQVNLLNRSSISTLHSFCFDVLRQYFHRVGLDPAVRVIDENEASLLRVAACEELFERRYDSQNNTSFTMLVDCYGGSRDDSSFREIILSLYDFARSTPDPRGWLTSAADAFNLRSGIGLENLPWIKELKRYTAYELESALQALKSAVSLAGRRDGPAAYLDALQNDLEQAQRLVGYFCGSWQELYEEFKKVAFISLKKCRQDISESIKNQVKSLRDEAKKKIGGLMESCFSRSLQEYIDELELIAPLMKELVQMVFDYGEIYRRFKSSRGLVDFSDLEHYTLQILSSYDAVTGMLVPSDAALRFREQFVEVLVDEYQDINAVQEAILMLVSRQGEGKPNLFMVGDAKQSIYQFRQAEPGLFLSKQKSYESLTEEIEEINKEKTYSPDKPGIVINLRNNFRSRRNILDSVNFIFRQIMTPGVGEIEYSPEVELVSGEDSLAPDEKIPPPEDWVELNLLQSGGDGLFLPVEDDQVKENEDEEESEALEGLQAEARFIGRRIIELVNARTASNACGKQSEKSELVPECRLYHYKDIAVLLRSTVQAAGIFLEEFGKLGIPVYAEASNGYFQATEVKTVLSLLTVIDNPRQDIPLAGVLRSALVGASAEDLAQIRLYKREDDFYEAVKLAADADGGKLQKRLAIFLDRLEKWRTMSRRERLPDLIWDIYRWTGYYDYVGALPGGAQRQANLRALHDRACQYETTAFRGLFRFLKFIEGLMQNDRDIGSARVLGENEDVVRIMSVHKSKGLEFPVVFIAGLGKRFNFRNLNKNILMHRKLGLGPQIVNPVIRISYPSLPKLAVKTRLRYESLAEELRILYVAMTRAREKLILVGTVRNIKKAANKWRSALDSKETRFSDSMLTSAGALLDWLGAALFRHCDGGPLRKTAGCDFEPFKDRSRWLVNLFEGRDTVLLPVLQATSETVGLLEKVQRLEPVNVEKEMANRVERLLNWNYPFAVYSGKPAKVAVTEAKRFFDLFPGGEDRAMIMEQVQTPSSPSFLRPLFLQAKRGLSAAERGRAMHLVLRHLNLSGSLTEPGIRRQITEMQDMELLTPEQAKSINVKSIVGFLESALGKRLLAAKNVRREVPFTLALTVNELYPASEKSFSSPVNEKFLDDAAEGIEAIVAQGMIDCLVDEGDGFLIIDFKTDSMPPGDLQKMRQLSSSYSSQLNFYARAVQSILNRPVKEKYLYFFSDGTALLIEP